MRTSPFYYFNLLMSSAWAQVRVLKWVVTRPRILPARNLFQQQKAVQKLASVELYITLRRNIIARMCVCAIIHKFRQTRAINWWRLRNQICIAKPLRSRYSPNYFEYNVVNKSVYRINFKLSQNVRDNKGHYS